MFVWSQLAGMVCGRSLGWRVYIYYNAEIRRLDPERTNAVAPQPLMARARARPTASDGPSNGLRAGGGVSAGRDREIPD